MKLPEDPKARMQYIRGLIGDVVRNGEFAAWMNHQVMPFAAIKEIDELYDLWLTLVDEEFGKDYSKGLDDRDFKE